MVVFLFEGERCSVLLDPTQIVVSVSPFAKVHVPWINGENAALSDFLESKGESGLTLLASNGGQSLHLENRSIDDEGAVLLAKGLVGTTIREVYLGSNTIGDRGATAIAQVLQQCSVRQIFFRLGGGS